MNKSIVSLVLTASILGGACASAQTTPPAPDNTKSNKTVPSNMGATADAQKNDAADIALTKRIRQSVMADKSLSTDAHNVKIVSIDGGVTLNGVVRSQEEKSTVESKAVEVAGRAHVTSELKIAPSK
jgi:hyperosmotically inducible periplasmic protein